MENDLTIYRRIYNFVSGKSSGIKCDMEVFADEKSLCELFTSLVTTQSIQTNNVKILYHPADRTSKNITSYKFEVCVAEDRRPIFEQILSGSSPYGCMGRLLQAKRDIDNKFLLAAAILLQLPNSRTKNQKNIQIEDIYVLAANLIEQTPEQINSFERAIFKPITASDIFEITEKNDFENQLVNDGWKIEKLGKFNITHDNISVLAKNIVNKAFNLPLIYYLIQYKPGNKNRLADVRALLKEILIIHNCDDITIKPLIKATEESITNHFCRILPNRSYTLFDAFYCLGSIAYKFRELGKIRLSKSEMKAVIEELTPKFESIKQIINDSDGTILIIDRGYYKFKYKHLRVILDGIGKAIDTRSLTIDQQMETITSYAGTVIVDESTTSNHLEWKFDELVIFVTVYLNNMDSLRRNELLLKLIEIAQGMTVTNRRLEARICCCLSYYLYEGVRLPSSITKKIFHASFGLALYNMQNVIWNVISDSTQLYTNTLNEYLKKACTLCEEEGRKFSEGEPYGIFLYHVNKCWTNIQMNDGNYFLKRSCQLQRSFWWEWSAKKGELEELFELTILANNILKSDALPNDDILSFVYGTNMLLYAYANIINLGSEIRRKKTLSEFKEIIFSKLKDASFFTIILETVVLCDYYTRIYNRYYDEIGEPKRCQEMYLLCGAFRFVCSYQLTEFDTKITGFDTKICLSSEQKEKYQKWYSQETGRYKCLLYRLLSYTNLSSDDFVCPSNEDFCEGFLKYDRMSSDYNVFINDPRKLHD